VKSSVSLGAWWCKLHSCAAAATLRNGLFYALCCAFRDDGGDLGYRANPTHTLAVVRNYRQICRSLLSEHQLVWADLVCVAAVLVRVCYVCLCADSCCWGRCVVACKLWFVRATVQACLRFQKCSYCCEAQEGLHAMWRKQPRYAMLRCAYAKSAAVSGFWVWFFGCWGLVETAGSCRGCNAEVRVCQVCLCMYICGHLLLC
jgi:hypothetical protein